MAEILIKDVAPVASINDDIKMPASTGGSKAETVTVGQIKEYIKKEIPKGDKGDPGIPGIPGPQGKPGKDGKDGITPDISNLATKDDLNNKQDKLVSGTNIATINNQDITKGGNITISGGGSGGTSNYNELTNKPKIGGVELSGDKTADELGLATKTDLENIAEIEVSETGEAPTNPNAKVWVDFSETPSEILESIPMFNHGTGDTTFALTPNIYHVWDEVATLNLTQAPSEDGVGVYMFEFISGASATQLTLPSEWKWVGGLPTINTNKKYQIGVVNNLAKVDEYEK